VQLTTEDIMRKLIAAPIVAGLVGFAALAAAPLAASAATAPTTTTFSVAGGDLTITAPGTNSTLGTYTLGDERDALVGSWTAGVTSTDFTTGTATANETVPAGDVTYTTADVTAPINSPATTYTSGTAGVLDNTTSLTAMSTVNESGPGGVSWNPTISVSLPAQTVAGTYSGTITHSVG
jgi:hypothetical protein